MKKHGEKLTNIISNTEMHFKIILGLYQDVMSQKAHSAGSLFMEEDIVQHLIKAIMDISKDTGKGKSQFKEGYSGYVFS